MNEGQVKLKEGSALASLWATAVLSLLDISGTAQAVAVKMGPLPN